MCCYTKENSEVHYHGGVLLDSLQTALRMGYSEICFRIARGVREMRAPVYCPLAIRRQILELPVWRACLQAKNYFMTF